MYERIRKIVAAQTGASPDLITPTTQLFKDPALSGLERTVFFRTLMNTFCVNILIEDWKELNTIEDIAAYIPSQQIYEKAQKTIIRGQLMLALLDASENVLPAKAGYDRAAFLPHNEIKSQQELLWTLDYVANTYTDRVRIRSCAGTGYMLWVDYCPIGHPVYLIASLYVLLLAGAEIHARYKLNGDDLYTRILNALAERSLIHRYTPRNPYSSKEAEAYIIENELTRLVALGDAPNTHCTFSLEKNTDIISMYYPSAHLLISDFQQDPQFTDKHQLFSHLCWNCTIDYYSFRAPTNEAYDVYLGFCHSDLFWGADAVVNSWNQHDFIKGKIPAIIFTDRPKDQVWLPDGIHDCCSVVFFEDYDCNYPLYDFARLTRD